MVQKKSLTLLLSGIATVTASASHITKVEYTGLRTEFAQEYAVLFEQEPREVRKQDCSGTGQSAHGYCGDHGCPSRGGGNNNGGSSKGSGGGNGGGTGGSKGSSTKK